MIRSDHPIRLAIVALALTLALISTARPALAERGHAIIVGIDDYETAGLPRLANAENDARKVAEYFTSQGYQVTRLLGSEGRGGKRQLMAAVNAVAARLQPQDNFVLFFAGHGKTETDGDLKVGYFVMLPEPGGRNYLVSAADIARISAKLDAAVHQLFIFDSCYSGLLGRLPTRGAVELDPGDPAEVVIERLRARKARQFLSAGGDSQEVLDGGPAGLSWFTYYLLKGLEPGVVSRRTGGFVTFTELASHVQVAASNHFHTPVFGPLSGHGDGNFVLFNTGHSRPPIPPLPKVSERTRTAFGFLARGDREETGAQLDSMRAPIDNLYRAWSTLDIDLYVRQLHPQIVQTILYKSGKRVARRYGQIVSQRSKQFPRLARVDVINYEVMYQGGDEREGVFGVRYNMDFHFKSGRVIRERSKKECYRVRFNAGLQRWQIIRNDDYLQRICSEG